MFRSDPDDLNDNNTLRLLYSGISRSAEPI